METSVNSPVPPCAWMSHVTNIQGSARWAVTPVTMVTIVTNSALETVKMMCAITMMENALLVNIKARYFIYFDIWVAILVCFLILCLNCNILFQFNTFHTKNSAA